VLSRFRGSGWDPKFVATVVAFGPPVVKRDHSRKEVIQMNRRTSGGPFRAWSTHWRTGKMILPIKGKALRFSTKRKPKTGNDGQLSFGI
jgi:hypothetical protein